MIFEEIVLTNYRQFAGSQTIRFASESRKNVTVIHGFNGSGKTTLLNAFTWLLYHDFSPDFEGTERLETEATFSQLDPGEQMTTSVKLVFRDGDRKYTAQRSMIIEKDENGERRVIETNQLSLRYIDELGEVKEPGNPQESLERLLPKRLHPFFFFNGERIERLARADAYEQIGEGVRTLLDIELFDRSIAHLDGEVSRRLRQEITKHAGNEGKQAQDEQDRLVAERKDVDNQLGQHRRNLAALESEREAIDAKLATMPELAKFQEQRKNAEATAKATRQNLRERKAELARVFSRNAYLLLVPDVLSKAGEILTARAKGELPAPMKRQFVQDLLDNGKCICSTLLEPGSPQRQHVEDWRQRALSDELESAATVTKAGIGSLENRAEVCMGEIVRLQKKQDELGMQLKELEEELSELSVKIGDRQHGEDPAKLEQQRRQIGEKIDNTKFDIRDAERRLQRLDELIAEKDREIRNLKRADEQGQLAQRRLDAVTNVKSALKQIREYRHEELREDLSDQLSDVWSRISIKDYRAHLDNNFRLELTKDVGGEEEPVRGASTGEKQVLSLAFVGALGAKARQTFEKSKKAKDPQELFGGGLYPLVIDSAFGSLEVEYRRDVAKWIPTLSPQVVLMVSESQWRREVEEELLPRIGAEWVLRCETPKNRSRAITLRGAEYPYVAQSDDGFERTTLLEVHNDV